MNRLKSIKKEVMRRELALAARRTRNQLNKEKKEAVATSKLGRTKYEAPSLELKLTNELPDSLRLLKVLFLPVYVYFCWMRITCKIWSRQVVKSSCIISIVVLMGDVCWCVVVFTCLCFK